MSGIFRIFIIILPLTISLAAYFLAVHALFPARVEKTKTILQGMPQRSFGVGLVNFSFFFIIAIILFSIADNVGNEFFKGVIMLPGLIILAFIGIMLTFGLAGMTAHVGERIVPDTLPWKQTIWGTVCLSFACALPFIGWFLLFPYIGLVGIGAFILGLFQREPKS
jgi:sorbitol-specific phosphotransferase system component IIBC